VDLKSERIFSIVEWNTSADKGTIVAVHGRATNTASCRVFERTGNYAYQLLTGDLACNFVSKPYKKDLVVIFKISVGQGYNSRRVRDKYVLMLDQRRMIFCYPNSVTEDNGC
jgi:hypothetical protein